MKVAIPITDKAMRFKEFLDALEPITKEKIDDVYILHSQGTETLNGEEYAIFEIEEEAGNVLHILGHEGTLVSLVWKGKEQCGN